jgi:hypothetical protein
MKIVPKLYESNIQFNNWVYPDENDLKLEYRIEYIGHHADPYHTFNTSEEFVKAVLNSKSYKITENTDQRIGNRSRTIDQEDLLSLIKGYRSYPEFRNEKTLQAIYDGFRNNSPMKMPIIMKFPNSHFRILSGNTRADAAIQLLGHYQGIILEISEKMKRTENKIVPKIKPILEDEGFTYLKKDTGNYKDSIGSEVSTIEPVDDTMADTKSPTSDEIGNIRVANNYWYSKSNGAKNINCNKKILKKDLKEIYSKFF